MFRARRLDFSSTKAFQTLPFGIFQKLFKEIFLLLKFSNSPTLASGPFDEIVFCSEECFFRSLQGYVYLVDIR